MTTKPTDEQLIKMTKDGDEQAFRELIHRYEACVAATVIGMLGQCQEADDVGQEVFIRFHKAMHRFRGDSQLSTYLTRIAINLSLSELKRRKRRQFFFQSTDDDIADISVNPNESIAQLEKKELVQRAIQKLASNFRAVIVLRLIEGYSTEETAKILKVPTGTVLSRLYRAQKKLKELLLPYIEDEI